MPHTVDEIAGIDWSGFYRGYRTEKREEPGSARARKAWDAKAEGFAKKPKRSDYIALLLDHLASCIAPEDSILDFGCGPGTLAVPLAKEGHHVQAVDFSAAMLDELAASAKEAGVSNMIQPIQRSWQESWEGIEVADVAIASRSLVTDDLANAVGKLESRGRKRVFVTLSAGDTPWRDRGILRIMGRDESSTSELPIELIALVNHLLFLGRLPQVKLIELQDTWNRGSEEELREVILRCHEPENERERRLLEGFLDEHIVRNDAEDRFELDMPRTIRWTCVDWRPSSITC